MKEIEIKILGINKERIISRLNQLGAKKIFQGQISGTVYDTNKNDLKRKKIFLRLRKEGNKSVLCFKSKKERNNQAKIREETEVEIDSIKDMSKILNGIGFFQTYQSRKYRISYRFGNIKFEIDTYLNLKIPTFLEIEAPSIKEIEKGVKLLGYGMNNTNSWSLPEVIKYYSKKK